MTRDELDQMERVIAQIEALHGEITALAKKSPNDGVNLFKLTFINKAIEHANELLKAQRPFPDFDSFDAEALPTTSDVTLMLAQYMAALEELRSQHVSLSYGSWVYRLDDGEEIRTRPPVTLRKGS